MDFWIVSDIINMYLENRQFSARGQAPECITIWLHFELVVDCLFGKRYNSL